MSGITYQRLENYCKRRGRSVAGLVEERIKELLDSEGVPIPREPEPVNHEQIASGYSTF